MPVLVLQGRLAVLVLLGRLPELVLLRLLLVGVGSRRLLLLRSAPLVLGLLLLLLRHAPRVLRLLRLGRPSVLARTGLALSVLPLPLLGLPAILRLPAVLRLSVLALPLLLGGLLLGHGRPPGVRLLLLLRRAPRVRLLRGWLLRLLLVRVGLLRLPVLGLAVLRLPVLRGAVRLALLRTRRRGTRCWSYPPGPGWGAPPPARARLAPQLMQSRSPGWNGSSQTGQFKVAMTHPRAHPGAVEPRREVLHVTSSRDPDVVHPPSLRPFVHGHLYSGPSSFSSVPDAGHRFVPFAPQRGQRHDALVGRPPPE